MFLPIDTYCRFVAGPAASCRFAAGPVSRTKSFFTLLPISFEVVPVDGFSRLLVTFTVSVSGRW